MTRLALAMFMLVTACAHGGPSFFGRPHQTTADSVYHVALTFLGAPMKPASLDSAIKYLDVYLATNNANAHRVEAAALRSLARDAQQLAKVEAALTHARASATETKVADARPADTKPREDESLKEIQRLKDELTKANEELERIRKRLASPKPPNPY